MFTHKEIKIELGEESIIKAPICDITIEDEPTKYRWADVTCPNCLKLRPPPNKTLIWGITLKIEDEKGDKNK